VQRVRDLTRLATDRMRRNFQEMRAGLHALRTEQDPPHTPPHALVSALLRFARSIATATLAGVIAGMLVLGLGGRLAMRIIGILGGQPVAGLLTENKNVVGDITLDGTVGLIVAGGVVGAFCGPLYAAARPLLVPLGRWQPLAFGVLFFLVFGSSCITPQNTDFRRFGPPLVNVTLFALIFVVFGMALASLTSAFDRTAVAQGATARVIRYDRRRILAILVLAIPVLAATWQTAVFITRIVTGR
jgi:hypothetical protein